MWRIRPDKNNCINIESVLYENGKLIAYDLAGYISIKEEIFNSVSGTHIPEYYINKARQTIKKIKGE